MERAKRGSIGGEQTAAVAANNAEEVAAEMAEGPAVTEAAVVEAAAERVNGK